MFTVIPSRRRVFVLLWLLVALPAGLVGGFALAAGTLKGVVVGAVLLAIVLVAIGGIARQLHSRDRPVQITTAEDPNPPRIGSNSRVRWKAAWAVAIGWNAIALAIVAAAAWREWHRGWDWLWVLLYPAVGLIFVRQAWKADRSYRRGPDAVLGLSPPQPRRGEPFDARFAFISPPPKERFVATLRCTESTHVAGRQYPSDTHGRNVRTTSWSEQSECTPFGSDLKVSFAPPVSAPASHDERGRYISWSVELLYPGEEEPRYFDIVMR